MYIYMVCFWWIDPLPFPCWLSVPPSISEITGKTVIEGGNVTLKCLAEGKPTPSIKWITISDDSVVTMPFLNISRHEVRDYRSLADNAFWIPAIRDVTIDVQCKCCNEQTCTHRDIQCVCVSLHSVYVCMPSWHKSSLNIRYVNVVEQMGFWLIFTLSLHFVFFQPIHLQMITMTVFIKIIGSLSKADLATKYKRVGPSTLSFLG